MLTTTVITNAATCEDYVGKWRTASPDDCTDSINFMFEWKSGGCESLSEPNSYTIGKADTRFEDDGTSDAILSSRHLNKEHLTLFESRHYIISGEKVIIGLLTTTLTKIDDNTLILQENRSNKSLNIDNGETTQYESNRKCVLTRIVNP